MSAIVIGDIPPLSPALLGWLSPRGPFCMPLMMSMSPISSSFGASFLFRQAS
jgi:hypothetical protein